MRIAIIQFPGSNCERETMLAVKRAGMQPEEFLWNQPKEKLAEYSGYVIVGGFSYEDRSRAGAIAALDPIMQTIKEQSKLGKPILGICNGAQILVETGLVPGIEQDQLGMALTDNKRIQNNKVLGTGYYNTWVHMRLSDKYQLNAFTKYLTSKDILSVPVAHGEGRFIIPPALLTEMKTHGLNLFQYCDAQGNIIDEFPVNPNGSINNIAAVANKMGNVMAMMPHPERTTACDLIFKSMRDYIQHGYAQPTAPLNYQPRHMDIAQYKLPKTHHELIIDSIITDNHAMSVENALQQVNIPARIKRQIHWEIVCDSLETLEKIKASGVLFNDRKESIAKPATQTSGSSFLVRTKDNMIGRQKQQMLEDHFNIQGIHSISHSVLWHVNGTKDTLGSLINSHILFNPYAYDCYHY